MVAGYHEEQRYSPWKTAVFSRRISSKDCSKTYIGVDVHSKDCFYDTAQVFLKPAHAAHAGCFTRSGCQLTLFISQDLMFQSPLGEFQAPSGTTCSTILLLSQFSKCGGVQINNEPVLSPVGSVFRPS